MAHRRLPAARKQKKKRKKDKRTTGQRDKKTKERSMSFRWEGALPKKKHTKKKERKGKSKIK
jgi:hypothetical protein